MRVNPGESSVMRVANLPRGPGRCHIRHMTRSILLLCGALCVTLALPLAAAQGAALGAVMTDQDIAMLRQVEGYLNSLTSLKAHFLQIGPDGRTSTGTAWLQRPGRMRFEYDKPSQLLLVAGHGQVVVRDNQSDQTSTIPMEQTPLGLLLRDHVTLQGDVTVTSFSHAPGRLQLTAVKTAASGDGSLTLVLGEQPLSLLGWSVVDAQGRETQLRLTDIVQGGNFDAKLFTYSDPNAFGQDGNGP